MVNSLQLRYRNRSAHRAAGQ